MNIDKINQKYSQFNIPSENIPSYENPQQFASRYEKCSILEYSNTSYSNSTCEYRKNNQC